MMKNTCIALFMAKSIKLQFQIRSVVKIFTEEMIDNTWRWARENGKIIKHAVSGGEFVEIDVEHMKRKTDETGQRMTQTAAGHFQACGWLVSLMHACMHACTELGTHKLEKHTSHGLEKIINVWQFEIKQSNYIYIYNLFVALVIDLCACMLFRTQSCLPSVCSGC